MGYTSKLLFSVLAIDFMLYLAGYTNGFAVVISQGWTSQAGVTIILASIFTAIIGAAAGAAISNLFAGSYSVIYTIPAGFFSGFLGSFLLQPMSFLVEVNLPAPIKWLLIMFLNIMLVAALLMFIRGTD